MVPVVSIMVKGDPPKSDMKGKILILFGMLEEGKFCHKGNNPRHDNCYNFYENGDLIQLSLWQPEFNKPNVWNTREDLKAGRVFR